MIQDNSIIRGVNTPTLLGNVLRRGMLIGVGSFARRKGYLQTSEPSVVSDVYVFVFAARASVSGIPAVSEMIFPSLR